MKSQNWHFPEKLSRAQHWTQISSQKTEFKDEHGRSCLLRGVNLCANSKLPTQPASDSFSSSNFYSHKDVSFIGRPFHLSRVDEHFSRLRGWGLTFIRLLVPWEGEKWIDAALEHQGPGIYDEEYISYLQKVLAKAQEYGMLCFIDPHQDTWYLVSNLGLASLEGVERRDGVLKQRDWIWQSLQRQERHMCMHCARINLNRISRYGRPTIPNLHQRPCLRFFSREARLHQRQCIRIHRSRPFCKRHLSNAIRILQSGSKGCRMWLDLKVSFF